MWSFPSSLVGTLLCLHLYFLFSLFIVILINIFRPLHPYLRVGKRMSDKVEHIDFKRQSVLFHDTEQEKWCHKRNQNIERYCRSYRSSCNKISGEPYQDTKTEADTLTFCKITNELRLDVRKVFRNMNY